jgi:hypothetical protein
MLSLPCSSVGNASDLIGLATVDLLVLRRPACLAGPVPAALGVQMPGIYERVGADGQRLGLDIAWKDATGRARRRTVHGGVQDARDELAKARSRRVKREAEPADPRVSLNTVADAFEAAHVAALRPNSQAVYRAALRRLRRRFGTRRMTSIAKVDVRALVAAERAEGLKAWTIASHLSVLSARCSLSLATTWTCRCRCRG